MGKVITQSAVNVNAQDIGTAPPLQQLGFSFVGAGAAGVAGRRLVFRSGPEEREETSGKRTGTGCTCCPAGSTLAARRLM